MRVQEPDHRHRGLLCPRYKRPRCRRAAKKRDEFAPLHVPPKLRTQSYGVRKRGSLRGHSDVRFGSLADILRCGNDVRFAQKRTCAVH